MRPHKHDTGYRGLSVIPRPEPDRPHYTAVNYRYAGQAGRIHEVVTVAGRRLAKVGFPDKKIVYYLLEDLEFDETARRGTFHDTE
jgi:hypothetical protein